MFRTRKVTVVVPAYRESGRIASTVALLPSFVDRIIVVDDASDDGTAAEAQHAGGPRVTVIRHDVNRGVGRAIATGYAEALRGGADIVVVVGGDGQMDPAEMASVVEPVACGRADYVKGNRLLRRGGWPAIPSVRLAGILVLSWATRLATGYRRLGDSQCGYTAISRATLERLPLDAIYPRYGYPNDLLVRLARLGARVADVPVTPLYGIGERSGLRVPAVVLPISRILAAGVLVRLRSAARRARAATVKPRVAHAVPSVR